MCLPPAALQEFDECKNCVASCNREGLMKRLDKQQTELEMCEKALADYMESKRRAFPRFYFVSSADLLDILSNGNNPVKVMQHMSKCFQVSCAIVQESSSSFIGEWAAWLALEALAHTAWAQCSSSRQCLAGSLAWPGSSWQRQHRPGAAAASVFWHATGPKAAAEAANHCFAVCFATEGSSAVPSKSTP